jgi:hypothetical protein
VIRALARFIVESQYGESTMNSFFVFLNQPFVLTIMSLTIGGFLVRLLSDRRARNDKIRDKAIELLTEIGENINEATSLLYGPIRREEPLSQPHRTLDEKIEILVNQQMGIRVRSEAFLKSNDFYVKYNSLIWQLSRIRDILEALSKEHDSNQVAAQVQKRIDNMREAWPLNDESLKEDHISPYRELFLWTQMIVNRAVDLLLSHLMSSVK